MAAQLLDRAQARRIAVRAQLLDATRPADLMTVLRHLTSIQFDQTNAVAPNADLVLWSRLGDAYRMTDLQAALADRRVIDLRGMLRPADDLALYRAEMAAWPGADAPAYRLGQAEWVKANEICRRDILRRLKASGPMTSREIPDSCKKPWASSGWNNNRNVVMLLGFMEQRGEIAAVGMEGRDRLWDLAERVHPAGAVVPLAEALHERNVRRLRSLGIARAKTTETPIEPNDVGPVGVPVTIEGVKGEWRVDPDLFEQLDRPFEGRTALISPLDRLVYDRARMVDLFEFDYALEMYKPVQERKWGYFALPILHGDRLVGKVDCTWDKKRRELRVDAVHEDVRFTKAMAAAVDREIAALAAWLGRERGAPGRG
jgi:uncharacterized protein YcaQ